MNLPVNKVSQQSSSPAVRQRGNAFSNWFFVIFSCCLLMIVVMSLGSGTQFDGVEFSPYSFQTRSFHYSSSSILPFGSQPKMTVDTASLSGAESVIKHLTNSTQTPKALGRWDLVNGNGFAESKSFVGEAWPLSRALQLYDANGINPVWEKWSLDHPNLAAILWPAIQELAIHHLYFVIPELLEDVYEEKSEEGLQAKIARFSAKGALSQSEKLVKLQEWEDAKGVIQFALQLCDRFAPESSGAIRLRELNEIVSSHLSGAELN